MAEDIAALRKRFQQLSAATDRLVKAEGEVSAAVAAGFRCAEALAAKKVRAEAMYCKKRQELWDAVFNTFKEQ